MSRPESDHGRKDPELELGDADSGPRKQGERAGDGSSDRPPAIFQFGEGEERSPGGERRGAPDKPTGVEEGRASTPSPSDGEREPLETGVPTELERLMARASESARAGRRHEAVEAYKGILALDARHVKARNNLAILLDATGDHEGALTQLRAALEWAPENLDVLSNLGAVLASLGRFEDAESRLRQALRIDPAHLDAQANLGILQYRRGLYQQAANELRKVCEKDPEHAMAHFYRGEALNRLGRVDEAVEVLERARDLTPENPRIYYLLGVLCDRQHRYDDAGRMYRRARELTRT